MNVIFKLTRLLWKSVLQNLNVCQDRCGCISDVEFFFHYRFCFYAWQPANILFTDCVEIRTIKHSFPLEVSMRFPFITRLYFLDFANSLACLGVFFFFPYSLMTLDVGVHRIVHSNMLRQVQFRVYFGVIYLGK